MATSYFTFNGRLRRRDYSVALFKLFVLFTIGANLLSFAGNSVGAPSSGGILQSSPVIMLIVGIAVLVPAMSLFIRRMNDISWNVRAQFTSARARVPLAVLGILLFQSMALFGSHSDNYSDILSPVLRLIFLVLVVAAFLPSDPQSNVHGPDPRTGTQIQTPVLTQKPNSVEVTTKTINWRPEQQVKAPTPTRHAERVHRSMPPATPMQDVVGRTQKMPEQGRMKPGWFS